MTVLDLPQLLDIDDIFDDEDGLRTYLARCVERGVMALDHVRPGWRDEIAIEVFDIRKTCNCVIGQLLDLDPTRPIIDVVREAESDPLVQALAVVAGLGPGRVYPTELGFDFSETVEDAAYRRAPDWTENYDTDAQFSILQDLWRDVLSAGSSK